MRKLFPPMYDKPEKGTAIASFFYWVVCFVLIPFVVLVLLIGLQNNITAIAWFDIAYYTVNFLFVIILFRRYLAEAFLNVQINTKSFFLTVLACTAGMLLFFAGYLFIGLRFGGASAFAALPMTETTVLADASVLVGTNPVFGILCVMLLTPVTVSCLYYAAVFAPIAVNRPWLAYLVMAAVLLIPRLFNIWWLENPGRELGLYLLQLPIHLLACWGYQKTDTVWAPIVSLSITNLLSSLVICLLMSAGWIGIV